MRLCRAWPRWVVLVFAGGALGAACSNSDHGPDFENPTPYPPNYCPCTKGLDGAVSILDGAPDGCVLYDGGGLCIVTLPPPPTEGGM